tara:strand:+ start:88536 stop:89084 length:549 start_codon:yes stop_codon:yes gene_type:complete
MFINYKCNSCKETDSRYIWREDDGTYTEEVLVKSATKAQLKAMDDSDDPRDYDVYKTVVYKTENPPEKVKCLKCKKVAIRVVVDAPSAFVKGSTHTKKKQTEQRIINGMGKEEAEKFYADSITNSNERIKSGGEAHYKKVDPNMEVFRKAGVAKKNTDKEAAHKKEFLKSANSKMVTNKDTK